jgi:hypothetical protein
VLFEEGKEQALEWTVDAMSHCVHGAIASSSTSVAKVTASSTQPASSCSTPAKPSLFGKLERAKAIASSPGAAPNNPGRSRDSLRRELEGYLAEGPIDAGDSALKWWAANQRVYPAVAGVARSLLAGPATSVPSERLFSKAGDIVSKKRNALKPHKAERVIFLMENM